MDEIWSRNIVGYDLGVNNGNQEFEKKIFMFLDLTSSPHFAEKNGY